MSMKEKITRWVACFNEKRKMGVFKNRQKLVVQQFAIADCTHIPAQNIQAVFAAYTF
jgi:hypothetical protein